jgi:hypothetical protein
LGAKISVFGRIFGEKGDISPKISEKSPKMKRNSVFGNVFGELQD